MDEFIPGQRWICSSELQLGLGTVLTQEHRTVNIVFLATGETRTYAKLSAPLTRVIFATGDQVLAHEGWQLTIQSVTEQDGLLTYHGTKYSNDNGDNGETASLHEGQLDNFIQLNRPADRLFSDQIDKNKWFELRYQTRKIASQLAHSPLFGLSGSRTSLIPHQLYIANEVANRYAPRVLLADEVGLGKTIEAGMILHHQIITEQTKRALIVVPETLMHQWLVEMLRRFNLQFSIFDEERCIALEEEWNGDADTDNEFDTVEDHVDIAEPSDIDTNPFNSEQLILCSLGFLTKHPTRFKQALATEWDMLIVDEAHHLAWSPEEASIEYTIIEQLAAQTKGVLLLTATPEQLGKESHYARLRLLDPDRFPDFERFVKEEQDYQPVAQAIEELLNSTDAPLGESSLETLQAMLTDADDKDMLEALNASDSTQKQQARLALVEHLLDRHGTGRVLFRNTRSAVKGFPQREALPAPLPMPEEYQSYLDKAAIAFTNNADTGDTGQDPQNLLSPELLYGLPNWVHFDPRITWLTDTLKKVGNEKLLVITSNAETALDIADVLRVKSGIQASVFHEGMSIIERDRSAAFFADKEYGTQILICSEIGSEGRNFQFAHHLVLFDLPFNPDLLEQRIGRLDRIGQTETIKIHIPYMEGTAQETMFNWYHHSLNAFTHTCPAGHSVFTKVQTQLTDALINNNKNHDDLISLSKQTYQRYNEALQHGRDKLLEFNSCRPKQAESLCLDMREADARYQQTADYMNLVFDTFGIDSEDHSENILIVHPGNHMKEHSFPGIPEGGTTLTFKRDIALENEDIQLISWEHPMVTGAMDLVLSSETGNTSLGVAKYKGVKAGTLLIEGLYMLESASSSRLLSSRYLPSTMIRVLIDHEGRDHSDMLDHETINDAFIKIDKETIRKVVRAKAEQLRSTLQFCRQQAELKTPAILNTAHQHIQTTLEKEINRLKALKKVNPNIRDNEIEFFESQWHALDDVINTAKPRLDALRVIITM